MNNILQDQVLFRTDWPVISMKGMVEEFSQLPLREGVRRKVLYDNARKLLTNIVSWEKFYRGPKPSRDGLKVQPEKFWCKTHGSLSHRPSVKAMVSVKR